MVNSKLKVREETEQGKPTRLNSIIVTGIPFRAEVKEKVPARKKRPQEKQRKMFAMFGIFAEQKQNQAT